MLYEKTRYIFDNTYMNEPLRFGDLYLVQIGRRYCDPSSVISAHSHINWFELTLVTAGKGRIYTNNEAEEVQPQDIYLSFPGDIHEIRANDDSKLEYDYFSFFCADSKWQSELEQIDRSPKNRSFKDDRISSLISLALAEFTGQKEYCTDLLDCIFHQIIIYLIRDFKEISKTLPEVSDAKILCLQLMNYIDAHIYSDETLESAAKEFNYNYSYLSSLFRKTTGKNLYEYYHERKMETAKVLLLENRKKIYEIAQMLNYSNQFSFSKAFKASFGISPKQMQIMASEKCSDKISN